MLSLKGFSLFRFAMVLLMGMVVTACASSADQSANQFDATTRPDATVVFQNDSLELGPADVIRVSVFGVPDLAGEYQVDFDGNIRFPLIGMVKAGGLTTGEFSQSLEQKLGEKYLQDPDVVVSVVESVGQRITIDGSVEQPGIYDLQGNMTLLQAVALAGGPGEGANPKKVVIFRQIDGQRMMAAFNLKDIREGEAEDPRVYGNDIVVMDGSVARARYGDLIRAAPIIGMFRFF